MRIVCPACQSTYEVPDRLIGAGRSLRCKACGHQWQLAPPEPESTPAAPAPPPASGDDPDPLEIQPVPLRPRAPQVIDPPLPRPEELERRGRLALRLAWAASLLAVAGLLAALWLFRAEVVQAWPPAARLFHLVGGSAAG